MLLIIETPDTRISGTSLVMEGKKCMHIELRELSQDDGKDILEMLREIGPGENGFLNDEFDMDEAEFRKVRDVIKGRVKQLLDSID